MGRTQDHGEGLLRNTQQQTAVALQANIAIWQEHRHVEKACFETHKHLIRSPTEQTQAGRNTEPRSRLASTQKQKITIAHQATKTIWHAHRNVKQRHASNHTTA